jgi:hypothetical protein
MRDTKTFIVFEVILTTATKNLFLCISFAQIEEHVHDQLRVLIHFIFVSSNCGPGRTIIKFISSLLNYRKHFIEFLRTPIFMHINQSGGGGKKPIFARHNKS